jgi:hypothetical protein
MKKNVSYAADTFGSIFSGISEGIKRRDVFGGSRRHL